jgi:hypothetical protein
MVAAVDKVVAQMGAHEAGTACDQHPVLLHAWLGLDGRALLPCDLRAALLEGAGIRTAVRRPVPGWSWV